MIDLHMHSTYSDGTNTVIELLKKAEEKKLTYISITDHDNCNCYNELNNIDVKKYYNGIIIPGIEIKCSYGKKLIEVLGYNINIHKMQKWVKEYYKDKTRDKIQTKYFNILYEKCSKIGLTMEEKEKINWNPKNDWASVTIYREIKKHEEKKNKLPEDLWEEFDTFSKKYCGDESNFWFIDKTEDYPSIDEAISAIKNAEGLVFLPHIYIYKWAKDKDKLLDDILNKYDIDGIECMHSTFSENEINKLIKLCNERGYYKSGGSDYHGKNKPNIDMGVGKGNLKIPEEFVIKWGKNNS